MSRLAELEARRAELLARCADQRAELARRIARLRPGAADTPAGEEGTEHGGARHPLAWIAVLGGLMLATRARELLSLLMFARSCVALASRAAQLLRLVRGRGTPRGAGTAAAAAAHGREGRARQA